jgi:hypothetical protein
MLSFHCYAKCYLQLISFQEKGDIERATRYYLTAIQVSFLTYLYLSFPSAFHLIHVSLNDVTLFFVPSFGQIFVTLGLTWLVPTPEKEG